ncbi:MAG: GNAT family N-acetyltransferase [Paracoccus sp. (in: a-proteobacteria)]|uniref:GNAT family N-acetyltransferase n=1 Tax=Paracoccus sp. TaxID=267 RepID=UPI0026DF45B0|nr:GNAT family N-acetyltransferase [Paracoccus sp. (in: a-proteobacteria)]MDO5631159.1 GNAT family N-acetyltransferase [Paracoccus sp. (in: a-proteobacteria)]
MTDVTVTKETHAEDTGRYVARIAGIDGEGELTFTPAGPGIISANHTGVPEAMGGRGVARAMLDVLMQDARSQGFRVIPRCSFVARQAARHPEWADLFTPPQGTVTPA